MEALVGGPMKDTKDSRVLSFYDVCRVSLHQEAFKPLHGRNHNVEDDEELEDDEMPNKYYHATACASGGIADANGGWAQKLF